MDGLFFGAFSLNDVVLKKTLGASNLQITIASTISIAGMLLSVFWANLMEGRSKGSFLVFAGFIGRLACVFMIFIASPGPFIILVLLVTVGTSITIPALSSIYQANYTSQSRGKFFGYATAVTQLAMIFMAFSAGWLLDQNENLYRLVFPGAGLLGFLGIWQFRKIRVRHRRGRVYNQEAKRMNWQNIVVNPVGQFISILHKDYYFRHFEINFFLYGLGFLMLQPIIPIFLVDNIGANYSQIATARSVINPLIFITLSPLFGRFLDKANPFQFSAFFYICLTTFPLMLFLSYSMITVYLAYVLFGIAMTGIHLVWNLGAIYFSGDRDSSAYMGVHSAMAGLRGIIAPSIGYLSMTFFSIRISFLISIGFISLAAIRAIIMHQKLKHDPKFMKS